MAVNYLWNSFVTILLYLCCFINIHHLYSCCTGSHRDSSYCSRFPPRHNALGEHDVRAMLDTCKASDIDDLMDTAMPKTLPRLPRMNLGKYTDGMTEAAFLEHFKYDSDTRFMNHISW